jgi:2'-hydroxyisoflavone reductase
MKILVLGGTVFLGRAFTEAALRAGHRVTHFNRGKTSAPDPRVETLLGDRTDAAALTAALRGREWDSVIDTSGYLPQVVRKSVELLRGAARHYVFVSSISVYAGPEFGEDGELSPPPDPVPEAMAMEHYGALKAMCEAEVSAAFGAKALILRPGLIVGPDDPTDRFTYWPARIARGGRVLAPGRAQRPVQFIDARDLAEWMVRLAERATGGTFNATGPTNGTSMRQLLAACRDVAANNAVLEWADDAFLLEHNVIPWTEMPLWVPEGDEKAGGLLDVPIGRARLNGLTFRPMGETIRATLVWHRTRPADHAWKAGMAADRETRLLQKLAATRRS